MKKKFIVCLAIVQIGIIGVLIVGVFKKTAEVKPSIGITNKDSIVRVQTEQYSFFFEPKSNNKYRDVGGFNATYTINKDSLNDRYDYPAEKENGVFRIITLGDSYTFGFHVSTQENWTELLEDKLNKIKSKKVQKFEVINLGVVAYDSAYSIERFKKRGEKYSPDLIVWLQFDFLRDTEQIFNELSKMPNFDSLSFNDQLKGWKKARMSIASKDRKEAVKEQEEIISQLGDITRSKIIIIPIPVMKEEFKRSMEKVAGEKHYIYADILRNFYNLHGILPNDDHPNQTGHRLIAEDIYGYLKKNMISAY